MYQLAISSILPVAVAILILARKMQKCDPSTRKTAVISLLLSASAHCVPKMLAILFAIIGNMKAAICSVCSHKQNRNLQDVSVGAVQRANFN